MLALVQLCFVKELLFEGSILHAAINISTGFDVKAVKKYTRVEDFH